LHSKFPQTTRAQSMHGGLSGGGWAAATIRHMPRKEYRNLGEADLLATSSEPLTAASPEWI
jgi:hypothetical protein